MNCRPRLWAWSKQQIPSHVISFPRIHLIRIVKKVEKMLLVHNSTSFDHKLCTQTWISERKHGEPHMVCGIRKSRFLHRLLFCTETRGERSPEATSANYAFSDLDSQPSRTENTSVFPLHSALPPYNLKFPLDLLWKHLMTISSQTWKWHQPLEDIIHLPSAKPLFEHLWSDAEVGVWWAFHWAGSFSYKYSLSAY